MAFRLLAAARSDVRAIAYRIAADNPQASLRWLDRMDERFARLGEMPGIGAPRPELEPHLRILPVGRYLIVYRHLGDDAVILRIVHGAREWERLPR